MPFGASRHVVSIKCHTPSRRMPIGASRQVGHFFNAIRHHDGCRLVHPAKWDIGKISGCLRDGCRLVHPSSGSFFITFNSHLRRIPFNESRLYYYSRSFGFRISHFNSIFTFVLSFQRYTQSHTHSCDHLYIYSFIYLFTNTHSCIPIHKYSITYSFTYTHSCILIHK